MVECTMRDIFNVGFIMVLAGAIANVLEGIGPPIMRALETDVGIAGILIVIYTSIKFYREGRKA